MLTENDITNPAVMNTGKIIQNFSKTSLITNLPKFYFTRIFTIANYGGYTWFPGMLNRVYRYMCMKFNCIL